MSAIKQNIGTDLNRDFIQIFKFDYDISNYTYGFQMGHKVTKSEIFETAIVLEKLSNYEIILTLVEADLSEIPTGVYDYYIKQTSTTDIDITVWCGDFVLTTEGKPPFITNDGETYSVIIKEKIYDGDGDMIMSVYDTNYNGVIDTCEYIDCGVF